MIGADLRGEKVEVAYREGKELRVETLAREEFLKRYGRRPHQVVLALSLRSIQVQSYTAEAPLEEEDLRMLAEDVTKQPYTLSLPAGEEGRSVYFLLGTGEPALPRAKQVPRFLAYLAELELPPNAVFVYADQGESLVALLLNGRFRILRTFFSGETVNSLLPEVEKVLRFAKTQGADPAPAVYVPESIAMDYAPLASEGHPVEVYRPEGLGALGALRLGEEGRWLFRAAVEEKPSVLLTPSPLGTLLALLGVGMALLVGGQYLSLEAARRQLEPQYRQALRVEQEYIQTKKRVQELEGVLKPWEDYLGQIRTKEGLQLTDYLAGISAEKGARLTALEVTVASSKTLEGRLKGKVRTPPVDYLRTLREEEKGLLTLGTYAQGGDLEVQVAWHLKNRGPIGDGR